MAKLPPFQRHSDTSRAAAISMAEQSGPLRMRVLAVLRASGPRGLIDEQIIAALGRSPSSVRPRRVELVEAGQVRDARRRRRTQSGRRAVVWVAVDDE